MSNILAVRIGEQQDWSNGTVDTGLRAVLAVNYIIADIQYYT